MMSENKLRKEIEDEESYNPIDRNDQRYHDGIISTLRLVLNSKGIYKSP